MEPERWRLLTTWGGEPGFNMALDEALLYSSHRPALRFYTWRPAALSLGYFQRWRDVPAIDRVEIASASENLMELEFVNGKLGRNYDMRPELPLVVRC